MRYAYPACFYPEDNERYSVDIPDLGLSTYGDSIADAFYMAADAMSGRVYSIIKDGEKPPVPSSITSVKPDDPSGFVSIVCCDLQNQDETVKKTLTLPGWLNEAAKKKSINFSAVLRDALIERLAD